MTTTAAGQQRQQNDKRPLIIAGALGLLTAVLVFIFLNGQGDKTATTPVVTTIAAVVARQDIASGTKITADMLEVRDLPEDALAEGYVPSTTDVIGKTTRYPLNAGDQVTQSRLVESPQALALSFQIPAGKRGMTIPVAISDTPAALIAPGDFVDVIMLIDVKFLDSSQPLIDPLVQPLPPDLATEDLMGTYTLLQNIQVLSVDRGHVEGGVPYDESTRGAPPADDASVSFVTLAVTPEQAQALFLAQREATLTIVLRPFGEDEENELKPFVEPFIIPQPNQ